MPRWVRTKWTPEAEMVLCAHYAENAFPTPQTRERLAARFGVTARSVQVWFQNRRQRDVTRRPANNVPPECATPCATPCATTECATPCAPSVSVVHAQSLYPLSDLACLVHAWMCERGALDCEAISSIAAILGTDETVVRVSVPLLL